MTAPPHSEGSAFVAASEVPIEDLGDGITRQILAFGPELMVARASFETGAIGYLHSHPHAQIAYVESGRFRASVGGVERELQAGDTYYAKPGVEHGAVCLEAGVLLDIFTPKRADFLDKENRT